MLSFRITTDDEIDYKIKRVYKKILDTNHVRLRFTTERLKVIVKNLNLLIKVMFSNVLKSARQILKTPINFIVRPKRNVLMN